MIQILTGNDPALRTASATLRRRVFLLEQGVPEEEIFDGADEGAIQVVAFDEGEPVATARLLRNGADWQIGCVAVERSRRGAGLGKAVVTAAIRIAEEQGRGDILLTAQEYATGFYEKLGFAPCGERIVYESGFVLIPMKKNLSR